MFRRMRAASYCSLSQQILTLHFSCFRVRAGCGEGCDVFDAETAAIAGKLSVDVDGIAAVCPPLEAEPVDGYTCSLWTRMQPYSEPFSCGTTPLPTLRNGPSLDAQETLTVSYLMYTLAGDKCNGKFLTEDYAAESELPLANLFLKESVHETCGASKSSKKSRKGR